MNENPAADWQALREHYGEMFDGELENLAEEIETLTETAQQALRAELNSRGLPEPGSTKRTGDETQGASRFASPDGLEMEADETCIGDEPAASRDFTWKTPLRECDTELEARQLSQALTRAGIDNWVELPGRGGFALASPRVVVAADQLEQAAQVASQPLPADILDDTATEVPEFETPHCPACGAEDPTLESADPVNSWLCEVCEKQWTEPIA